MRGYEEVIDVQMDLLRWWKTEQGLAYAEAFVNSLQQRAQNNDDLVASAVPTTVPELREAVCGMQSHFSTTNWNATMPPPYFQQVQQAMLHNAVPYFVAPEVATLVEHAAKTFQAEALRPDDLPTPTGFVVLPEPFRITDRHGKTISFRAFTWHPALGRDFSVEVTKTDKRQGQEGIVITLYSHLLDKDDYWNEVFADYDDIMASGGTGGLPLYCLVYWSPWIFGDADILKFEPHTATLFGLIQCFWRLAMQTITEVAPQRAPRGQRKRAEREGMKHGEDVLLVRLRRKHHDAPEGHEPKNVEWSYQWIVTGHWRNQWFATQQTHRQIWINPFVKGPEGKPLKTHKLRVVEFVR